MVSLLIGIMETSLMIQMASAFHNKIIQNAMPWHTDSAPSHSWQQAATSCLFPAWTTALVAAHLWSQGLGSLQTTQNPGGWKTTMAMPKCLNGSCYMDKIWAENVLRLIRGALTAAVSDKFTVIHIIEKHILPLAHFSLKNNDATPLMVFPG